jgi:Kef-type K+ transport system membrane component KefB
VGLTTSCWTIARHNRENTVRRTIAALVVVLLVVFTKGKLSSAPAQAVLHLGCLAIVGYVLARLVEDIRVPMAMGFALAGFLLGPGLTGLVGDTEGVLRALGTVFLGWVGFCVGSRFKLGAKYLSKRLVIVGVISVLVGVLVATLAWSILLPGIYITLVIAVVMMLPDPFWAFAATRESGKRTREGALRALGIVGLGTACLCWATAVGAIRRLDGGSLWGTLEPAAHLLLSAGAGILWGELVHHLCGVLRSRSAVLVVFLVSVLGASVAAGAYQANLMVVAVAGGIWIANRGAKAAFVLETITPIGYAMVGPLFAVFGTQIPARAILSGITWPIALICLGTMIAAKMGVGVLAAHVCRAPGASASYLSCGTLLQGLVLLEMVRWTQTLLAGSSTFGAASDLFVALAGMGMLAGSLLLPMCTAWAWRAERGR